MPRAGGADEVGDYLLVIWRVAKREGGLITQSTLDPPPQS